MTDQPSLFNFMIDSETREKLEALAAMTQRSQSGVLRWLIQQEYARLTNQPAFPTITVNTEGQ